MGLGTQTCLTEVGFADYGDGGLPQVVGLGTQNSQTSQRKATAGGGIRHTEFTDLPAGGRIHRLELPRVMEKEARG
jgi:hypothetical protein